MKKLIFVAFPLALISCGGNENSENDSETSDSTQVENSNQDELNMDISDFVHFEDYGLIKTKEQLYSVFGDDNLDDDTAWFAEGETMFMCTNLTNPENGWKITYVYKEDDPETVSFIETNYRNYDENYNDLGTQKVEASNGLYTGMPLADLVKWNESDFDFAGFGWDYEGGISAKEGTKIALSPVMISLTMDVHDVLPDKYQQLYGDQMMNSADDIVQGAPIVISYMSYFVESFD